MADGYYRTGVAAKELRISTHQLRCLCRAGIIEAELTDGDHWRIPVSEVARWRGKEIPPIPQTLKAEGADATQGSPAPRPPSPDLCASPSEKVISSAEDVTITENQLRKRKIELQAEELEDSFQEREQRQADKAAAERQAALEASARALHREWENKWLSYALQLVPRDAPQMKLEVHDFVQGALAKLSPDRPRDVVKQIVDAAADRFIAPWRRGQKVARIINQAVDQLPVGARSVWKPTERQLQATEAARHAVRQLGDDASLDEVEAVAVRAVEPVRREYEHQQLCVRVFSSIPSVLSGENAQVIEEAIKAVAQSVAALPIGAPWRDFERLRDQALKPFKDSITRRQHQMACEDAVRLASRTFPFGMEDPLKKQAADSMRAAVEKLPLATPRSEILNVAESALKPFLNVHHLKEKKERLITDGLGEIHTYLLVLSEEWELEEPLWNLAQELKDKVGEELQEQLGGKETLDDVKLLVRRIVADEMDIQ